MSDKKTLTLGSLFDGSGGFPLAGMLAGIKPVWSSEVSPFPILVTHKRMPQVKHYGDVSKLKGSELEPVDIITFGSPCQDMSVAGKRAGLDGERSGLFHQAIRIIKEMRDATNGRYPRYAVWENVGGAFSSNEGNDFKAVLEAFIGVKEKDVSVPAPEKGKWAKADLLLGDGWSVAYRTLDSQYWGVPQRRTRIYLVADFNGESAGEVLFKSEGMSGYSAESFSAWQRAAASLEESIGDASGQSGITVTEEVVRRLMAENKGNDPESTENNRYSRLVLNDQGGDRMDVTDDVTCTLRAQAHHPPCVLREKDNEIKSAGFCTEHSAKARSIGYEEEKSPTLRAGVVPAALSLENHPTDSRIKIIEDGKVQTLCSRAGTGGNNVPMIAESMYGISRHAKPAIVESVSPTLVEKGPHTVAASDIKAFGICAKASNSMLSDNPHSGFYEAETSRTLDRGCARPDCSQGGIAIVEPYHVRDIGAHSADVSNTLDDSVNHVSSNQGGILIVNPDEPETYDVRFTSEGTKNARGHCYKTDTSRCLDTGGESPEGNHGGVAIVSFATNQRDEVRDLKDKSGALQAQPGMKQQTFVLQGSMIGRDDKNGPRGSGVNEDVSFTLNTTDKHAVAMPVEDDKTYCSTVGSFMHAEEEKANTLMARDYKDPQIINAKQDDEPVYIVRRLTPTECARLQGFPDWWCKGLANPTPSDEEIAFWKNVWDEWNLMSNKKAKSENQIRKWLADPYSDMAEYALWGNGITATVAWFVLAGIAWWSEKENLATTE